MVLVEQTIVDKTRLMKRGLAVFVTETEVTGGSRYGISSTDARNKEQVNRPESISSVQEYGNVL